MKLNHSQYFLIFLTLVASTYTLMAIGKWWLADKAFAQGKNLADAGYISQGFPLLEQAVQLMPGEPLFHSGLAEATAKIAWGLAQQPATPAAHQATQLAIAESDKTIKLNPVHVNFWKTRIQILLILAQLDPNFTLSALDALHTALTLAPTDAKLTYNLGLLYLQLGQVATAKTNFQAALQLKPSASTRRF